MVKDCSLLTNKVSQIKNEEACNSLAGCQNREYLNDQYCGVKAKRNNGGEGHTCGSNPS